MGRNLARYLYQISAVAGLVISPLTDLLLIAACRHIDKAAGRTAGDVGRAVAGHADGTEKLIARRTVGGVDGRGTFAPGLVALFRLTLPRFDNNGVTGGGI